MTNSKIIIRLARPAELRRIQDLNAEVFASDQQWFHDLNMNWPYEADGVKYFTKRIAGEGGVCLVAEGAGEIIGYVAGGLQKPHPAYTGKRAELENIGVTPAYRSHGAGAKLVQAFYDWCKQQGVDHVMVNAYSLNSRAIKFYAEQGFENYSTTLWHHL